MSAVAGILGGLGLAGAGIGAAGSEAAAGTQASAANNAAALQYASGQNALGFEQQVFNQQQANEAPFIGAGQAASGELSNLLGLTPTNPSLVSNGASLPGTSAVPGATGGQTGPTPGAVNNTVATAQGGNGLNGVSAANQAAQPTSQQTIGGINYNLPTGTGTGSGALTQGWDQEFQAPTAASAAQTPGYQFALQQGQNAIQNSAAAQGGVLNGGTVKALDQYSQGLADTNYQNVYNNALTQYQTAYNQFQQNQSNTYNRLAGVSGTGQTATGQLGSEGTSAANTASNTLLGTANAVGTNINNAGAANASGYAGIANAASGGLGSIGNTLTLASLLGNQNSSANSSALTNLASGDDAYY